MKFFCSVLRLIFLCSNFYPPIKTVLVRIISGKGMQQKSMVKMSRNFVRILWGYPLPVLAENLIISSSRDHVSWGFVLCNGDLFIFLTVIVFWFPDG